MENFLALLNGFFIMKSRPGLFFVMICKGVRRQALPSWGGSAGLTLLRLSILPSSWVLAVLEVAVLWRHTTKEK